MADCRAKLAFELRAAPDASESDFILTAISPSPNSAVAIVVDVRGAKEAQSGPRLATAIEMVANLWADSLGVVLSCDPGHIEWLTLDRDGNCHALVPTRGDNETATNPTWVPLSSLVTAVDKLGSVFHKLYPEAARFLTWRLAQLAVVTDQKRALRKRRRAAPRRVVSQYECNGGGWPIGEREEPGISFAKRHKKFSG